MSLVAIEDVTDSLLASEDAQLQLQQRQCSELCDQMTLCLDIHMQRVYATLCQHFHPEDAVHAPTMKTEQLCRQAIATRLAVQRRVETESSDDATSGGPVRIARGLQARVDLAYQRVKRAQAQLAAAREQLEEERSSFAEYEAHRRALRRQRLHRLTVLAENASALKRELKHLYELRELQTEGLAVHQRSAAGTTYAHGDEYVLIRQNQNSLQALVAKQRRVEALLGHAEDVVVAGGGMREHQQQQEEEGPSEGHTPQQQEQQPQRSAGWSAPSHATGAEAAAARAAPSSATAARLRALDARSHALHGDWIDPVALAFAPHGATQPQQQQQQQADTAPGVAIRRSDTVDRTVGDDDDDDDRSHDGSVASSHSRYTYAHRRDAAAGGGGPGNTTRAAVSHAAWFTPQMPTELLRVSGDADTAVAHRGARTPWRGEERSRPGRSSSSSASRRHDRQSTAPLASFAPSATSRRHRDSRAPLPTPATFSSHSVVEARTPFLYHSHTRLGKAAVSDDDGRPTQARGALLNIQRPDERLDDRPVTGIRSAAPPSASALADMKEATHTLLRTELLKALDGAGTQVPQQQRHVTRSAVQDVTTAEALDLQRLLRARAAHFLKP